MTVDRYSGLCASYEFAVRNYQSHYDMLFSSVLLAEG